MKNNKSQCDKHNVIFNGKLTLELDKQSGFKIHILSIRLIYVLEKKVISKKSIFYIFNVSDNKKL